MMRGERTYAGFVGPDKECHVSVRDGDGPMRPLPLRLDVRSHSPTGLAWGYGGSGPAQLALALLCDALGREPSPWLYQEFKRAVVSGWPMNRAWEIGRAEILAWVNASQEQDPG